MISIVMLFHFIHPYQDFLFSSFKIIMDLKEKQEKYKSRHMCVHASLTLSRGQLLTVIAMWSTPGSTDWHDTFSQPLLTSLSGPLTFSFVLGLHLSPVLHHVASSWFPPICECCRLLHLSDLNF